MYQRQQGEGSNHDESVCFSFLQSSLASIPRLIYVLVSDTLIVWTEPDGTDYALSFQDVEGCAEIWDFIVEVQRHFRGKSSSIPPLSPKLSTYIASQMLKPTNHLLLHYRQPRTQAPDPMANPPLPPNHASQ